MAKKFYYDTFDSITHMLATLEKRSENRVFKGSRELSSQSQSKSRDKFYGTATFAEAEELIRYGWDEPVKELKSELSKLQAKSNVTTQKARPRNSVVGYAPCVPAAIMGLPESMIATERVPSKVKAVSIIYGNTDAAGASRAEYLKAGAVMLKLVNDLELKGYRVRLICEFKAAIEGEEVSGARVVIKDWKQPLDLRKIAFPIAHPSMQRRFGFRHLETVPGINVSGWRYSYGGNLARTWDYDRQAKEYKSAGLLTDGDYFATKQLVEECDYDTEALMKRMGMALN